LRLESTAGTVTVAAGNQFAGDNYYIDNRSTQNFDLSANSSTFDGFSASGASVPADLATLYGVENKMYDYLDDPNVGYTKIKSGYVFVTHVSETTTAAAIQRGINVASATNTIYVQAGSYVANSVSNPGGLDVNKSLTMYGAQAGVDARTRSGAETVIVPGLSNPDPFSATARLVMYVSASSVTIDGFTVNGDNTSLTSGVIYNGADIDASEGIVSYEGLSNIT